MEMEMQIQAKLVRNLWLLYGDTWRNNYEVLEIKFYLFYYIALKIDDVLEDD